MQETRIEARTTERQHTILVVDDNPDSLELLSFALSGEGYKVIKAGDGKYAVLKASEEHPDLIVMDLTLPEMDGIEASRRIRGVPKLADVPIYAVTGYPIAEVSTDALSAGCKEVLEKPLDLDILLQKIKQTLALKPGSYKHPREVLRVRVSIPVHWGLTTECAHLGTITSISIKGCLVQTNLIVPLSNKAIHVRFHQPDEYLMLLEGGVLYYLRNVGFGMEFRNLSPEDRGILGRIVKSKTRQV